MLLGFLQTLMGRQSFRAQTPEARGFLAKLLEARRKPPEPQRPEGFGLPEVTPEQEAAAFAEGPVDAFLHFGQWLPVQSSNIKALRYFPDESKMEVEFLNGNFYNVDDISLREAEGIATAASHGKWYWSHVRVRGKGNFFATRKGYQFLFGPRPPQWLRSAKVRKIHALFTKGAAIRRPRVLGRRIEKILMPKGRRA